MKKLIFSLMLVIPLSGCGAHKAEKGSEAKAAEPSANVVAQAFDPPASMFRFLDSVIDEVVKLNPGSDSISMKDLEAIDVAALKASAQEARLDLSKLESLTNYLSPKTKLKITDYFKSQHSDMGTSLDTKTLKKAEISAAYDSFKKFFGMPASELQNSKSVLEAKDFTPAKFEAGGMNLLGVGDIIKYALALGFLVFYIIPAVIVLIVAVAVLSPILAPLFTLLELLVLFAITFGRLI